MTAPLRVLKNKTIHTIFVKGQNGLPLHAEDRLSSYPTKGIHPLHLIKMLPFSEGLIEGVHYSFYGEVWSIIISPIENKSLSFLKLYICYFVHNDCMKDKEKPLLQNG